MSGRGITRGDLVGCGSLALVAGVLACGVLWVGAHMVDVERAREEDRRDWEEYRRHRAEREEQWKAMTPSPEGKGVRL